MAETLAHGAERRVRKGAEAINVTSRLRGGQQEPSIAIGSGLRSIPAQSGARYRITMTTIILLIISNIFMTFAWYGNLRFPHMPMIVAILTGWGIALIEYCFAVPANRIGFAHGYSGGQLKVLQEVITLTIFALFAALFLKEPIGLRFAGAFACLIGAACFMFVGKA